MLQHNQGLRAAGSEDVQLVAWLRGRTPSTASHARSHPRDSKTPFCSVEAPTLHVTLWVASYGPEASPITYKMFVPIQKAGIPIGR